MPLAGLVYLMVRDGPFLCTLKIRTMFGFRWMGGLREFGCSDFRKKNKYVHLKGIFIQVFFFPCVYLIFLKTNMIKLTLKMHDICTFYAGNKMVVLVYVFFSFLLFRFWGGWMGQRKFKHCSDFKNTYTKMDNPLSRISPWKVLFDSKMPFQSISCLKYFFYLSTSTFTIQYQQ